MSIIHADPNRMRGFADYVSEFGSHILNDCEALESATARLASSMSSEDIQTIEAMVNSIDAIIQSASPVFQKLDGALNIYADYIDKAKRIANGG